MSIYFFENQNQSKLEVNFKFEPLSFSWVAIHPQPKGVIQFIGGAFFGSFPTVFYHYFLNKLYEAKYTIIALPFRFTFDHWSISLELLREQYELRPELLQKVIDLGYDPEIYLDDGNYRWIGHSLGCKYILLLELLSGFKAPQMDDSNWEEIWQEIKPSLPNLNDKDVQKVARQLERHKVQVKDIYNEWLKIKKTIEKMIGHEINLKRLFIRNELSLLIAPDISDTSSAIPIKFVADFLDAKGCGAKPTKEQTQCLVRASDLFSLTSIISFQKDMIAGNLENSTCDSDVAWLVSNLKHRLRGVQQLENAYHLEPHGHQAGKYVVDFPGSIVVWSTGIIFAPLSPLAKPAKAFFNEVRKPIIKTLSKREILEQTAISLLE